MAAASENAYVGARACGSCHPSQFGRQSATGHARTLFRAHEHPLASRFVPADPLLRPPRFRFAFERAGQGLRVQVRDDQAELEIPIEWAFGSGTHGVTFVSRLADDSYLEHAFTYYSDTGSFDLTPGHRSLPSRTLIEAAGQTFRLRGAGFTIRGCFQCHSTGTVTLSTRQQIEITEPGVRCEVCHGPGRTHVEAATRGDLRHARQAIRNPRSLPPEDLNRLCGLCHRSADGGPAANDFTNPWNVRHQPPYLEQSKCFRTSGGALSCLTCHSPHEALRRNDPDSYREKCAACHIRGDRQPPAKICLAGAEPDCTGCHMPAVAADPHLKFRNHWIGVYRRGANLMPSR